MARADEAGARRQAADVDAGRDRPTSPTPRTCWRSAYGPSKGEGNWSRFDLPEYNADFRRIHELPDGPERSAAIAQAQKLLLA